MIIFLSSIGILTFLAYYRSLHAPLIFDDVIYISPSKLKNLPDYFSLHARSVANLSFALNYQLSGMNLAAFRMTNVLFHMISGMLAFLLTRITLGLPYMRNRYGKFNDPGTPLYISFCVAALFLLHPIQTSAVNYITQRMAIMAVMFSFAGIILYVKAALTNGKQALFSYGLSVICFILAIFSKENAVMILPVLMLYDYCFISSFSWSEFRKRFIPIAVFCVILIAAVANYINAWQIIRQIIMSFLNPYQPLETFAWSGMDVHCTPLEYIMTELRIVSRYIFLIFVPLPTYMVFDYSNTYPVSTDLFNPITTILSLFFILTLLFLSLRYLKKIPLIAFGILWYMITISLESFIALGLDPYFEHRNYLPVYGLFLASASLFIYADKLVLKINKITIILIIALLLAALTYTRNGTWRDGIFLWENSVVKSPNNARARVNLGVAYNLKGWPDRAIEQFEIALRLKPDAADIHNNLGIAYAKKGWFDKAFGEHRAALKLKPDYYDAHYNMGLALFRMGDTDKAIEEYKAALRINPDLARAHVNLGIAYGSKGSMDDAIEHFMTAISLEPDFAEAYNNLGIAYARLGSLDKAIEQFETAVRLQPDYEKARENLEILKKKGR